MTEKKSESKVQTLGEWELEKGIVILGKVNLKDKATEDEIMELILDPNKYVGVNHEDRTKFLEDNGYEVTRENLIDSSLSCRPKEEEA